MTNEKKEEEKKEQEESPEEDGKMSEEEGSEELAPEEKAQKIKERQAEAEAREKEEKKEVKPAPKPVKKEVPTEEEDDDFWKDDEEKEKEEKFTLDDLDKIVERKVAPILEQEQKRKAMEKQKAREDFFNVHPEYLSNAKKWQTLLDELDNFDPNSKLGYISLLERAHRIIDGASVHQENIENQKVEMALGANGGEEGSRVPNTQAQEDAAGLMLEDKKIAKQWGVSLETMKEMKKREKEGSVVIHT
jgi:hypothetical protein